MWKWNINHQNEKKLKPREKKIQVIRDGYNYPSLSWLINSE